MFEATMVTTSRWDIHGNPLSPLRWEWDGARWTAQRDGSLGSAGGASPTGPGDVR